MKQVKIFKNPSQIEELNSFLLTITPDSLSVVSNNVENMIVVEYDNGLITEEAIKNEICKLKSANYKDILNKKILLANMYKDIEHKEKAIPEFEEKSYRLETLVKSSRDKKGKVDAKISNEYTIAFKEYMSRKTNIDQLKQAAQNTKEDIDLALLKTESLDTIEI